MRAGRIGRRGMYGNDARWGVRLWLAAVVALALYLLITRPAETAGAVAHVAHQLTVFVQSFQ